MHVQDVRSVLMFHGVGDPVHPYEPGEGDYWISENSFDEILGCCGSLPKESYYFTFDDGNASDIVAARQMRDRGIDGSFFVLVGRVDKPGYLSKEDLLELVDLDMEVGLHGRDHIDWRDADHETLRSEVESAAGELEQLCRKPITSVAIPYGAYNRRVWNHLQRSPFSKIYTSDRGPSRRSDRFVRREPVMAWHSGADVTNLVTGKVPAATRLRRAVMPLLKRLA